MKKLLRAKFVIHVYPSGRLGNQLFYAANAKFLALKASESNLKSKVVWHTNVNLLSDIQHIIDVSEYKIYEDLIFSFYKLGNIKDSNFIIRGLFKFLLKLRNVSKLNVAIENFQDTNFKLLTGEKLLLDSFIQLAPVIEELKPTFHELPEHLVKLSASLKTHRFIAVHMRQGDFLEKSVLQDQGVLDFIYFRNVISTIRATDPAAASRPILVFSDDPAAASVLITKAEVDNFEMAIEFGLSYIDELRLMGTFEDVVLSTSTFSWWAGYLAQPDTKVHAPVPLTRNRLNEAAAMKNWTRHTASFSE